MTVKIRDKAPLKLKTSRMISDPFGLIIQHTNSGKTMSAWPVERPRV